MTSNTTNKQQGIEALELAIKKVEETIKSYNGVLKVPWLSKLDNNHW